MCGILGQISIGKDLSIDNFKQMLSSLNHRGPDGSGVFMTEAKNIALGHKRLSFIDLSMAANQPLSNLDKSIWVTFNGEIYNYLELKAELEESYSFSTKSDTEVLIAAYKKWGIGFINKLKGMFAFGLYDENKQKLFIVRDRFGIKPLYYYKDKNSFLFASEMKAILASKIPKKEIDFKAFSDYFVYRYIPSPQTIWKDIHKVPPAHYLEVDTQSLSISVQEYWELSVGNNKKENKELVAEINSILLTSVKEHIRSDVPVGSFLSGGYDSSTLVMYMKQLGKVPETFSIGFSNWNKSEDRFAKIVADHLKVPNESIVADNKSLELLNLMPIVYDEPIADISIIPTFLVSKLAKQKVKAVLSGEGADEIFGGYTWQHDFYEKNYPEGFFEKIKANFQSIDTVSFYAQAMSMGNFDREELKKMLHSNLHQYIREDVHWFYKKHFKADLSPLKAIQYMDIKCFMGELVLTKIDRASMANSLEVRVPFLDHILFEKLFLIDEKEYFNPYQTKSILYENIKESLPKEILERKKQGFVGPDAYYMDLNFYRKELKNSQLVQHKIINKSYLDNLLNETYNWKLWKILVMENWFKTWIVNAV